MFPYVVGEALRPAKVSVGQFRRAIGASAKSAPGDAPVLIHARPQLQEQGDRLSLLADLIGIDETPGVRPNVCQLSLFPPVLFLPFRPFLLLFRQCGRREISTPVANEERRIHGLQIARKYDLNPAARTGTAPDVCSTPVIRL